MDKQDNPMGLQFNDANVDQIKRISKALGEMIKVRDTQDDGSVKEYEGHLILVEVTGFFEIFVEHHDPEPGGLGGEYIIFDISEPNIEAIITEKAGGK